MTGRTMFTLKSRGRKVKYYRAVNPASGRIGRGRFRPGRPSHRFRFRRPHRRHGGRSIADYEAVAGDTAGFAQN